MGGDYPKELQLLLNFVVTKKTCLFSFPLTLEDNGFSLCLVILLPF